MCCCRGRKERERTYVEEFSTYTTRSDKQELGLGYHPRCERSHKTTPPDQLVIGPDGGCAYLVLHRVDRSRESITHVVVGPVRGKESVFEIVELCRLEWAI